MKYCYHILIFQNDSDYYTAVPVENIHYCGYFESISSFATSEKEAKNSLTKRLLSIQKGLHEEDIEKSLPEPRLESVKSIVIAVSILSENKDDNGIIRHSDYAIRIPFLCLYGKISEKVNLVSLPYMGIEFYCHQSESLKLRVGYEVNNFLKNQGIESILAYLPFKNYALDKIYITPLKKKRELQWNARFETLSNVAYPLDTPDKKDKTAWYNDFTDQLFQDLIKEIPCILLVGDSDFAKNATLINAIKKMKRQRTTERKNPQFFQTSAQQLIAGKKYLGEWEKQCEKVISDLISIGGTLCVENLRDLILTGGKDHYTSIANFFMPYLQKGELRLIICASKAEIHACQRLMPGFVDFFKRLEMPSVQRSDLLKIIDRIAAHAETNKNTTIKKDVRILILNLFSRFYPYSDMLGPCIDFLENFVELTKDEMDNNNASATSDLGTDTASKTRRIITQAQVINEFIQQTGLPELLLRDEIPLDVSDIFNALSHEVIGQDHACQLASDVIITFKAGLNDPKRPISVLFFYGPTGVGKTQLAKAIAGYCFKCAQEENQVIRLDMSEYSGINAGDRLIGGQMGTESDLIRKVRQSPFSVILLDEIEKASPEVFDILLNVFDEGRLTDTFGRETSFRSTIIILTSNLGVSSKAPVGFESIEQSVYIKEIKKFFRPEFINRMDEIVPFVHLSTTDIQKILLKELKNIELREALRNKQIKLSWTNDVIHALAKSGFNKNYGARFLKRSIEDLFVIPLAKYMLSNSVPKGAKIDVQYDGEKIVFSHSHL